MIEDPISPQLNLTNNLYKLAEVQKELCDALERFRRLCVSATLCLTTCRHRSPTPRLLPHLPATPSAEKAAEELGRMVGGGASRATTTR